LIAPERLQRVEGYLELARSSGAEILVGGDRPNLPASLDRGNFLNPTILTGVGHQDRCSQEEIFGPVVTVAAFDTEEEAIEVANGTT
jgi:aminomuconate-semialdehyde/2-hydroxymuconate-6-semialdehyde dehydrogenase